VRSNAAGERAKNDAAGKSPHRAALGAQQRASAPAMPQASSEVPQERASVRKRCRRRVPPSAEQVSKGNARSAKKRPSANERKEKRAAEATRTDRCLSEASFELFRRREAFFSSVGDSLDLFCFVFWVKPKNEVGSKGQRPLTEKIKSKSFAIIY
jgi:hypothetical protein